MPSKIIFPSAEEMNGINEDRKKIILMSAKLYHSRFPSIPKILKELNYQKLPPDDGSSRTTFHRILDFEKYCKECDSYSGIEFSDLREAMENKFSIYLNKKQETTLNIDKITTDFDFLFFIYYWSSSEKVTKVGLLTINKDKISNSRYSYFQKNISGEYVETSHLNVAKFDYENSDLINIVLQSPTHKRVINIIANKGTKPINELGVVPALCVGTFRNNPCVLSGKGYLHRIEKYDFKNSMEKICKEGIHPNIINRIYRQKLETTYDEDGPFNSPDEINSINRKPLSRLSGYWKGYFFKTSDDSQKKCIVKCIMEVEESGIAVIHFERTSKKYTTYNGFFKFPDRKDNAIVVGEFEMQDDEAHRIVMNLKPNGENGTYEGVSSGWRSYDLCFFSTPIYFEKIAELSSEQTLEQMKATHKPAIYDESKKNEFRDEIEKLNRLKKHIFEDI